MAHKESPHQPTVKKQLGSVAMSAPAESDPSASSKKIRLSRPGHREAIYAATGFVIALALIGILTLMSHSHKPLKPKSAIITAQWIPPTVTYWHTQIDTMAKKYQIDPDLIAIVMTLESGGDPKAESQDEAKGLMQITPLTAQDIAHKYLKEPRNNYDLFDPATNVEFGAAYLSYLRDTFGKYQQGPSWDSTVELVAAGYNGGPGAAQNLFDGKGLKDTQTVVYSRDAFNMWRERAADDSPTYDRWLERGGTELVKAANKREHP